MIDTPLVADAPAMLPERDRRLVITLAAQGRAHPDPAVAAAAVAQVRRLNRRDRTVRHLLLGVGAVAFHGGILSLLIAGGSVRNGPWWPWLVFLLAVPAAVIAAGEWEVGVLRRGLRPEAEPPNLRMLLECAEPGRTVPVTITRFRGLRAWWPVLVPAAAVVGWLTWRNLHVPAKLMEGLRSAAIIMLFWGLFLLVVAARRLMRRWRGMPPQSADAATPIIIDASGLRFRSLPEAVTWSEVSAVGLLGPTPAEPQAPVAVRWSLHGRDPIVIEADDMAQPPETAIRATWAHRPDLRWRPVDGDKPVS
ncbi:hypothetical protein [Catellatospora sichuanensis]|uniref:hypothetical protein n=1 Tax=Catellatospora sichuanensis TaxID=1969805 RepID=UPI0011824EAD|nr:hypothetical protein [Catellatospora sichuanensis]